MRTGPAGTRELIALKEGSQGAKIPNSKLAEVCEIWRSSRWQLGALRSLADHTLAEAQNVLCMADERWDATEPGQDTHPPGLPGSCVRRWRPRASRCLRSGSRGSRRWRRSRARRPSCRRRATATWRRCRWATARGAQHAQHTQHTHSGFWPSWTCLPDLKLCCDVLRALDVPSTSPLPAL